MLKKVTPRVKKKVVLNLYLQFKKQNHQNTWKSFVYAVLPEIEEDGRKGKLSPESILLVQGWYILMMHYSYTNRV